MHPGPPEACPLTELSAQVVVTTARKSQARSFLRVLKEIFPLRLVRHKAPVFSTLHAEIKTASQACMAVGNLIEEGCLKPVYFPCSQAMSVPSLNANDTGALLAGGVRICGMRLPSTMASLSSLPPPELSTALG